MRRVDLWDGKSSPGTDTHSSCKFCSKKINITPQVEVKPVPSKPNLVWETGSHWRCRIVQNEHHHRIKERETSSIFNIANWVLRLGSKFDNY